MSITALDSWVNHHVCRARNSARLSYFRLDKGHINVFVSVCARVLEEVRDVRLLTYLFRVTHFLPSVDLTTVSFHFSDPLPPLSTVAAQIGRVSQCYVAIP